MKLRKMKSILLIVGGLLFSIGCSQTFEGKDPIGYEFPRVRAQSLDGRSVKIPRVFQEKFVVLLVGYLQKSQFDIDRWLLGLAQLKTPVLVAELPTVRGFFPKLFRSRIDSGMKSGIPEEDWSLVYTIYDDSEIVAKLLGTVQPRNARVVLLDTRGKVIWFHDRGYSASKMTELDSHIRNLLAGGVSDGDIAR